MFLNKGTAGQPTIDTFMYCGLVCFVLIQIDYFSNNRSPERRRRHGNNNSTARGFSQCPAEALAQDRRTEVF